MQLEKNSGPMPKHSSRAAQSTPCLAYIIRKEEMAKGGNNVDKRPRVVGGIQHTEPFQCMVGFAAMNLFVSLYSDTSISFFAGRNGRKPAWQENRIISGWAAEGKAGYETARKAYHRVLTACNISWAKVTHLRKAGMDEASKEGLNDETVGSMSKHVQQKIARYVDYSIFIHVILYPA